RALAIEPRLLLLDEPFGALDAQVRKELRRWLLEIHKETGHTTVFVTHDQEEALELSDRVVVMRDGRIEQVGTPDEIVRAAPFREPSPSCGGKADRGASTSKSTARATASKSRCRRISTRCSARLPFS